MKSRPQVAFWLSLFFLCVVSCSSDISTPPSANNQSSDTHSLSAFDFNLDRLDVVITNSLPLIVGDALVFEFSGENAAGQTIELDNATVSQMYVADTTSLVDPSNPINAVDFPANFVETDISGQHSSNRFMLTASNAGRFTWVFTFFMPNDQVRYAAYISQVVVPEDPSPPNGGKDVILLTDFAGDVDDMAMLDLAHQLADTGEINEILAVLINTVGPWSAGAANAVNNHYGRPDIPIGVYHELNPWPSGTPFPPHGGGSYSFIGHPNFAHCWPHNNTNITQAPPPNVDASNVVLRNALLSLPAGRKASLVTVGYLSDLYDYFLDVSGTPTNKELFKLKVERVVAMLGRFKPLDQPNCGDANTTSMGAALMSGVVLDHLTDAGMPEMVISGAEIGDAMKIGSVLEDIVDFNRPARAAFEAYNGGPGSGNFSARFAWDPSALYEAVRPGEFVTYVQGDLQYTLDYNFTPPYGCTQLIPNPMGNQRVMVLPPQNEILFESAMDALLETTPNNYLQPNPACTHYPN